MLLIYSYLCGTIETVMEMLIQRVVRNEALRNEDMIRQYECLMEELPHGSLICRRGEYYYLKFREGGKLHDEYIGKDPKLIADIQDKLECRRHYAKMLSALKQERKVIQKMLERCE